MTSDSGPADGAVDRTAEQELSGTYDKCQLSSFICGTWLRKDQRQWEYLITRFDVERVNARVSIRFLCTHYRADKINSTTAYENRLVSRDARLEEKITKKIEHYSRNDE